MGKGNNLKEQIGNVSKEAETLEMSQKERL